MAGEAGIYGGNIISKEVLLAHVVANRREADKLESKRSQAESKRRDELMYRYYETAANPKAVPGSKGRTEL